MYLLYFRGSNIENPNFWPKSAQRKNKQLNTALVMERSSIAFLTDVTLRLNSLNPKRKGKQRSMWMKQTLFAQKNSQVSQPIIFQTTAKA